MTKSARLRLGVNVDHVATVRNARGGSHPDPVRAALAAVAAGADSITVHLRQDRRHIIDRDIHDLMDSLPVPLNLEIAATAEMTEFALRRRPSAVCIVPERREERTTEGGLDVAASEGVLKPIIKRLLGAGIRVSLFVEPDTCQVEAAVRLQATAVELHTGRYSRLGGEELRAELRRIFETARLARAFGIEVHAGHGITFDNVSSIAAISQIAELNVGHFLIGEAIFVGLDASIGRMRELMDRSR